MSVVFLMFRPLLIPFILAAILANTFYFLYVWLLKYLRLKWLSSLIVCILVALIIIIPILLILSLAVNEIQSLVQFISNHPAYLQDAISKFSAELTSMQFMRDTGLETSVRYEAIIDFLKNFSEYLLPIFQVTVNGIGWLVFSAFIMFFSLFYLLIDGDRLIKKIMLFSPLKDSYERILINKFNLMTQATIKGQIFLGIIQGFLAWFIFWVTGVASPVFLGIITVLATVIPNVGSALVWLPVGLIMIVLGFPLKGSLILIFGAMVILPIYNLLAPKLIGSSSHMHPLLVLFSIVGGISLLGITGFIIGPIIMSIFVTLLDIYSTEFRKQLEASNG